MMTSAGDAYRKQSVLTASPAELIVLLYEGLKKDLLLAKRHIERGQPSEAHERLMKAQAIVVELVGSLDMSVEMSEQLLDIYEFLIISMAEANLKKDAALLPPLIDIVSELKEAWEAVAAQNRGILELVNE